jgi:hypothetical protein
MTGEDRELIEAWRAIANAKLTEYRRQCWRLALLVRRGIITRTATVDRLWEMPPPTRSCALSVKTASKPSSMKHLPVPTFGPCSRWSHEKGLQHQSRTRLR